MYWTYVAQLQQEIDEEHHLLGKQGPRKQTRMESYSTPTREN
jgi:hypothetical protein